MGERFVKRQGYRKEEYPTGNEGKMQRTEYEIIIGFSD